MNQLEWNKLTKEQRAALADNSGLSPQLIGLEGWRVDVGNRRFIVGKSTGWRPCHLELYNRRSLGGSPADKHYEIVRPLYRVR